MAQGRIRSTFPPLANSDDGKASMKPADTTVMFFMLSASARSADFSTINEAPLSVGKQARPVSGKTYKEPRRGE